MFSKIKLKSSNTSTVLTHVIFQRWLQRQLTIFVRFDWLQLGTYNNLGTGLIQKHCFSSLKVRPMCYRKNQIGTIGSLALGWHAFNFFLSCQWKCSCFSGQTGKCLVTLMAPCSNTQKLILQLSRAILCTFKLWPQTKCTINLLWPWKERKMQMFQILNGNL